MSAELLPCPFCKKLDTLSVSSASDIFGNVSDEPYDHTEAYVVVCDASTSNRLGGCGASAGYQLTKEDAIKAWNTRASPTPPEAKGESGWQPIETAPKNFKELIGYREDQGVFVFKWSDMEEQVPKDLHGDPAEEYDENFACWWHDRWGWMENELAPTHWMPLPDEPNALIPSIEQREG